MLLTTAHVLTLQAYCDGRAEPLGLRAPLRDAVWSLRWRVSLRVAGVHAPLTDDDVVVLAALIRAMCADAHVVLDAHDTLPIARAQARFRLQFARALHEVRAAIAACRTHDAAVRDAAPRQDGDAGGP